MKYVTGLRCKECGADYPVSPEHVCERCFGPVEVVYDLEAVAADIDRADIEAGPRSLWRYEALLPSPANRIDIGAGWSLLRPAPRLAAELGLKKLWLKFEGSNPTHSFKDRVVTVALSCAQHFGFEIAACASTGNLANAVAAHAAAAGMQSIVFIPRGLERGKIAATTVYGGKVFEVEGSYDDVNRLCGELVSMKDWAFVNVNMRAFYSEGSKTLAFETAEQLGWREPDAIVIPVASGSLLTKVARGFRELRSVGLLTGDGPRATLHGAQAEGCSPIAAAFAAGETEVQPVKPNTIAKSLAIGDPADGYFALKEVATAGGSISAVPERSIAEGMRLLAQTEGVFTETAGGVTIACLERLVAAGTISPHEETIALITGVGLKTLEALGDGSAPKAVPANVDAVERALEEVV